MQLCGFEHSLAYLSLGLEWKTDLFQSHGHCWVFQICSKIVRNIWHNQTGSWEEFNESVGRVKITQKVHWRSLRTSYHLSNWVSGQISCVERVTWRRNRLKWRDIANILTSLKRSWWINSRKFFSSLPYDLLKYEFYGDTNFVSFTYTHSKNNIRHVMHSV